MKQEGDPDIQRKYTENLITCQISSFALTSRGRGTNLVLEAIITSSQLPSNILFVCLFVYYLRENEPV